MKIFCIAIKDNNHSIKMLNDCLESADKFNWNIETYWGIDKEYITDQTWKDLNLIPSKDKKFQRRLGAQGCFLSHYHLWLQCLNANEPIIILEHDAIINQELTAINTDKDLIKLYKNKRTINTDQYTGNWTVGSHAYYLKPVGAKKLIQWSKENFGYHIDVMIGTNILDYDYLDYDLVKLNENNISIITIK